MRNLSIVSWDAIKRRVWKKIGIYFYLTSRGTSDYTSCVIKALIKYKTWNKGIFDKLRFTNLFISIFSEFYCLNITTFVGIVWTRYHQLPLRFIVKHCHELDIWSFKFNVFLFPRICCININLTILTTTKKLFISFTPDHICNNSSMTF